MAELLRHGFVHRQLEKVEEHLEAVLEHGPTREDGPEVSPEVHRELLTAVRNAREVEGDPGAAPYFSRHPVVGLAQSALHERLAEKRARGEVEHDDERMGDPFTKADIGWVVEIALSLLWRGLAGRHAFCDSPARHEISEERVRLVLFSDWGTGLEGARNVSEQAQPWIDGADCPVHAIHLGDVYYSGTPREMEENALALWPVAKEKAAEVGSWALLGNHDMYSGGHGFFEDLLGEERFARQRAADGSPTSWFSLQSPGWHVVGLDTAWNDELPFEAAFGHLYGSQADHVAECARDPDRRLLLLSHHQLFTVHDDEGVGKHIHEALAPVLEEHGVDVWFWGHEHDCVAYHPHLGVTAARAIGHGAVPVTVPDTPATSPNVDWQFDQYRVENGLKWAKHGFAVVDLDGEKMTVHHVDDEGNVHHSEPLP